MNKFKSFTSLLLFFSAVFSILLLVGCRPKPIKLKVESAPEKLVVFSHLVPDHYMIITLTKSFSVLDGIDVQKVSSLLVSGATVQIKFNNQTFDFIELNPGIYISYNEAYEYNQEYELIISSGDHFVTSKTVMLPKTVFSNCLPQVDKYPSDTSIFVNVAFNDVPDKSNWYMINVYAKTNGYNNLDGVNYFQIGKNTSVQTLLLSDQEFSGAYSNKIKLEGVKPQDSIVVTLSNISEKYFNYLKVRSTSEGSILNQLNMEPISYPSNITNGYGFFNAHFPDIKYYDLSQY
jgi:hypothetical protein